VDAGSPADQAGIKPGDVIVSVNGETFHFFGEENAIDALRRNAGQTVTIGIEHPDGRTELQTIQLRQATQTEGPLGIRQTPEQRFEGAVRYVGHDPGTALQMGAADTSRWFGLILSGLRDVASAFLTNPTAPPEGVQGPVGIARSIGDIFWGQGPILTLYVAGILSANLALVNALPFPPLDGGRMLVIVLKRLLGTRITLEAERVTYFVGFAFLMAFLLWVTYFDVFGSTVR
jgi:regulator of sigma E protease